MRVGRLGLQNVRAVALHVSISTAVITGQGEMLLKIAFVLLIAWLLGVVGLYRIGDLVHVLLLVGLMLLLLAALKARDAAMDPGRDVGSGES
jgi:Family of unknown function (DUF5670)